MNSLTTYRRALLTSAIVCLCLTTLTPQQAGAQLAPAPNDGERKLESLLDGAQMLYRKQYSEQAKRYRYITDFSLSGTKTRIMLEVLVPYSRKDGTKFYLVKMQALVKELPQGQSYSNTVVKRVAYANIVPDTGSFAVLDNLIVTSSSAYLDSLSADHFFLLMLDMHRNRTSLAAAIDEIMKAEAAEN